MAHADVAETVEHALVRDDAVGERELIADVVDDAGHEQVSFGMGIMKDVMPGLVPGIYIFFVKRHYKTWMAGHQGVHARLRRAMPGHDVVQRSTPLQRVLTSPVAYRGYRTGRRRPAG